MLNVFLFEKIAIQCFAIQRSKETQGKFNLLVPWRKSASSLRLIKFKEITL